MYERDETEEVGGTPGISISPADLLAKARESRTFTTGSAGLDRLLGGGLKAGRVVQFFGRSNSGKSQLGMQTSLYAAREGLRVLFVDTEGSFRPERLTEMADARGWESGAILERIVYVRCDSSGEQMEAVRRMERREATKGTNLVVVDTLTRNFTLEMPGRANLASRQGALDVHLSEIARDAALYSRSYFLANRVTFGDPNDVGIGGRTVEQLVDSAVRLERRGDVVKGTLLRGGRSETGTLGKRGID